MDTANHLAETVSTQGGSAYVRDATHAAALESAAQNVKHKQLPHALSAGVGFHYAAMEQEDRAIVEQLFLNRLLPVRIHAWKKSHFVNSHP